MSNTTTITGNLTREPKIRYTHEGQATTQLGVAVNRRWQDQVHPGMAGSNVVLRRRLLAGPGGERGAQPLQGVHVVVTGRLGRAVGRPTTMSTAPRSRSRPTRSARACASPPPMCSGSNADRRPNQSLSR